MADLWIHPSSLQGDLTIPASKSHTLRAILFGALAKGTSHVEHFLSSPDTTAMIDAVRLLGAKIQIEPDVLHISGFGGIPQRADDVIQCGNSGQVLRFVGALAGLIPLFTILTGDASLRYRRPLAPLLSAMEQLGAFAISTKDDGHAPIVIRGPFTKKIAYLDGADSQPISGLLIAAAFASHPIELHVINPGEKPWIDLTLDWFNRLGIPYSAQNYTYYSLEGSAQIKGFSYRVPGDFSTAAFGIAAALATRSELTLHNIDIEDIQGDKALILVLEQMGALFHLNKKNKTLTIEKNSRLKGGLVDINNFIDALPILAVLGCFAENPIEIINGTIARKKESDRISCIARELKKMGARIKEKQDGLTIYPSQLNGAELNTYNDHRLALSLSIAALGATSPSKIGGIECANKTYSSFYDDFRKIGAQLCI